MTRPFCVGLTGGVGSGKSTISRLFAELGAEVIDTDIIARDLTGPNGAAMPGVVRVFGSEFRLADGSLDRGRMRQTVFADAAARRDLEHLLHPLIRAEAERRLVVATGAYVVLVVPLLVESDAYADLVDRVLVVDCSESQQLQRASLRDGMSDAQAKAMLAAQVSRDKRLALADDVVDNSGDLAALPAQVKRLHAYYCRLAAQSPASIA